MATSPHSEQATRPNLSFFNLPSPLRQASYFATGALAGASTIPIEYAWSTLTGPKTPATLPLLRSHAFALTGRAGTRFWVFDITKSHLPAALPVWFTGGLLGATGGLAEVCAQSLFQRKIPGLRALLSQGGKLFFCFGTYTYLSTTLSPQELPPRPFWYCWLMGATAGGVGCAIVNGLEGVRGRALWLGAVPKGILTIGTVIAVQVTSCAEVLNRVDP
ncbi:hypothetical protein B0A49_05339 [Cryomyces minteri]|uniref:Uncharacterized protein n=1 Tax=Cryomyces minteri TaxID=331657 RepID=A0A4U0X654_9PEZI|nr:hypothetical protein B0A49_05339 [Cryomyces minteri]